MHTGPRPDLAGLTRPYATEPYLGQDYRTRPNRIPPRICLALRRCPQLTLPYKTRPRGTSPLRALARDTPSRLGPPKQVKSRTKLNHVQPRSATTRHV